MGLFFHDNSTPAAFLRLAGFVGRQQFSHLLKFNTMKNPIQWQPEDESMSMRNFCKGLPTGHRHVTNFHSDKVELYEKAIDGYPSLYIDKVAFDDRGEILENYFRLVLTDANADLTEFWGNFRNLSNQSKP